MIYAEASWVAAKWLSDNSITNWTVQGDVRMIHYPNGLFSLLVKHLQDIKE